MTPATPFVCTCGSDDVWREEVDIGVGVQYGPWSCNACGITHRDRFLGIMFDDDMDDFDDRATSGEGAGL